MLEGSETGWGRVSQGESGVDLDPSALIGNSNTESFLEVQDNESDWLQLRAKLDCLSGCPVMLLVWMPCCNLQNITPKKVLGITSKTIKRRQKFLYQTRPLSVRFLRTTEVPNSH